MPSGADLFVVCKNCGSEVSPYITECPYCGHRLRRRAPKLPRDDRRRATTARPLGKRSCSAGLRCRSSARRAPPRADLEPGARRRAAVRDDRARGGRRDQWVLLRARLRRRSDSVGVLGPLQGDWWKLFTAQFAYLNGGYAFVTLLVVAIFGWLMERRTGRSSCWRCSSPRAPRACSSPRPSTRSRSSSAPTPGRSHCSPHGRRPTCAPREPTTTTRATCSAPALWPR